MNGFAAFLAWPLALRLSLVAMSGLVAAALVNWAVYSLAYQSRHWSPWSRHHVRDARSHFADRVPLVGWLRLRRMAASHGSPFWLRPLIVEIVCAAGFAARYHWEAVLGGLLSPHVAPGIIAANLDLAWSLHAGCLVHLVLFTFMLAASLIDADEWNIPDEVTVPGTLIGVALSTMVPTASLPAAFNRQFMSMPEPLDAAWPFNWPAAWAIGEPPGLVAGVAALWFWCFGLIVGGRWPPLRDTAHRYRLAAALFLRRVLRDPWFPYVMGIAVVGALAVVGVWSFVPSRWPALLSSLLGVAGGAATVWVVRVLGSWAFQKEAMGFGDVTLMAMIGAFVGWQPVLLIFFLAPAAAIVVYVPAMLIRRSHELPYGPYLCASTLGVVLFWGEVWNFAGPRFTVAWLIPVVLVGGFFMLGLCLAILRKFRE